MKKLFTLVLAALMLLSVCAVASAEETVTVYVTISAMGAPVTIAEPIVLTDIDGDSTLTVNDALYLIHEEGFEGGAAEGYASANSDYGLMITKLWGIENGGSYGYYVNDAMAYSLTDPLNDGDRLNAFTYSDLETWSDTYAYFDKAFVEAAAGDEITLTLCMVGWDENYMPVSIPLAGAVITFDGVATEYVTGEDGSVTFTLPESASYISAVSETVNLVPPICTVK